MTAVPLISRLLVPPTATAPPEGFTRLRTRLVRGLPDSINLDADARLTLAAPTGRARFWLATDPATVVADSNWEQAGIDPAAPVPGDPRIDMPFRFYLVSGGRFHAVLPLRRSLARLAPDAGAGEHGVTIALIVLGYLVHAGCVRGQGDFGSWIELAFRRVDGGAELFQAPVARRELRRRLSGLDGAGSDIGVAHGIDHIGGLYWRGLTHAS